MKYWWQLSDEEVERLNPPMTVITMGQDGNWWALYPDHPNWMNVGHVPRPRTWMGWFAYHVIHGLAMRYPPLKVLGFALASSGRNSEVFVDVGDLEPSNMEEEYRNYLLWVNVPGGQGGSPMSYEEFCAWMGKE